MEAKGCHFPSKGPKTNHHEAEEPCHNPLWSKMVSPLTIDQLELLLMQQSPNHVNCNNINWSKAPNWQQVSPKHGFYSLTMIWQPPVALSGKNRYRDCIFSLLKAKFKISLNILNAWKQWQFSISTEQYIYNVILYYIKAIFYLLPAVNFWTLRIWCDDSECPH